MLRRWDTDERGHGVADAGRLAPEARVLVDAMAEPDRVAEGPEAHLPPHVLRACDRQGETGTRGEPRAAVFALVGEFAEFASRGHTVRLTVAGAVG